MRAFTAAAIVIGLYPLFAFAEAIVDPLSPSGINQRIQQHRTAEATVTILGADGNPLAHAAVTVRQVRHKFLFGCNAFVINPADTSGLQKDYQRRFTDLLNFATLPFYWGAYERTEGKPDAERVKMMAKWCADNGIATKGHPLVWQQVAPRWLAGRSIEDVHRLQLYRITRDVTELRGRIDRWDVVNESVSMPIYKGETTPIPELCAKVGRVELIKQAFATARQANPDAVLILNDYDTTPGSEKVIEDCLAAGVPIDVIGIQSHMHAGYWGAQKTWDVCNRFARFDKPIHFTESTILSADGKKNQRWNGPAYTDWTTTPEGEARQAQQVAEFYSILFSHPQVHAITWWDFSDHRAWLGAPAGLVRKDMSPKPAYEALMKLVKDEWWTKETALKTNARGKVTFRGFLGEYTFATPAGRGAFVLDHSGTARVTVKTRSGS
jgi:GH35 family endo-1,4-beta-xylanase